MRQSRRSLASAAIAALVLALLAGCGGDAVSLDPPEISYGEAISEMGMFVTDPRYTVAALPEEGDWILFDDIGEMLKFHDRNPGTEFRATWVHDYHSEEWLKAEDAWYVQSAGFTTPMGWMVGTFADEEAARSFQAMNGGEVMTWEEATTREWTDPPAPDDPILGDPGRHGGHASPVASPGATLEATPEATLEATPAGGHRH